jgi:ribosome maturation factor RimP
VTAVADRVSRVLAPLVAEAGLDLEDVDVQPAGRRRLLRVVVDGDDGVDLDTVAALTRELSRALDAADAMGDQPYVLEVSSPGVDRPLTQPRHWRRARGRLVQVTLLDGSTTTGRLTDVDEQAATSALQVSPSETLRLSFAQVRLARVQVELNRPAPAPATDGAADVDDEPTGG